MAAAPLTDEPVLLRCAAPWVLAASLLLGTTAAAAATRVSVQGLDDELADNARASLSLLAAVRDEMDHPGTLRRLYRKGDDEIRTALQPFGYYTPVIESSVEGDFPDARVVFKVDPGLRTRVGRVEILVEGEGHADELLDKLIDNFPLEVGEPLRHAPYSAFKQRLSQAAYGRGFIDAQLTRQQLRVDPSVQRAEILLTLDTGRRFRFGEVRIEQDVLDDEVIRRYVPIEPGQWFDPEVLIETQFALTDLEYFSQVDVQPLRADADGDRVPVLIQAQRRPRTRYEAGIGYGTDTGARLSGGIERRWVNSRGHKLDSDLQLSEIRNLVGTEYIIPLGSKAGERLSFPVSYTEERYDSGNSRKYAVGASLSRIPGQWQRRLYVDFTHERFELGDDVRSTNLLTPGIALNRSEMDDEIYPRRGWSIFADTHGSQEGLLSDTTFVQGRTLLRGVLPLGERNRWLSRVEYGATWVDEFSVLPSSQRLFAGGDQSVRGYGYQSLGPRDENGEVIGGKYLFTASAEVERLVWGNIGLAAFYDIGGAGDDPAPKLFAGTGLGLRYRSPIGSLRLDIAHPLDGDGSGVRLHFGIRVGL